MTERRPVKSIAEVWSLLLTLRSRVYKIATAPVKKLQKIAKSSITQFVRMLLRFGRPTEFKHVTGMY